MASTSQALPKTWVATIALVSLSIRSSMACESRFQLALSMSTKIGLIPSHCSELVVATKLNGVVMALPDSFNAR